MWRVLRIAIVALTLSALVATPTLAADRALSPGAQAVRPWLSDPEVPDILPFVQPGNPPRAINLRGVAGVEFRGPLTLVLPLEWTATRSYPTDFTTGHPRGLAYFSGTGPNLSRAMCQRLTLPGNQVALVFDHRFNLQQFADFGVVELSTDEGASFTTLIDYTGTSGGWESQEIDLTQFGGQDVVICFRLLTDADIDGEVNDGFPGWYLDNIALVATQPSTAALTGAEEVPGPGDPDGTGSASITLLQGVGQVCFDLSVRNIATATAAHIHRGALGVAGPVEVPLTPPAANGFSSGCVTGVSATLIGEILNHPAGFYVNVHNASFPNGAVRGQLAPGAGEQRTVVGDGNLFPWKSESQLRPIPLTFNVSVQGLDRFGNIVVDIPVEVLPIDNGSQGGSLDRRGLAGLFDRPQNVYTAQAVVDFDLPGGPAAPFRGRVEAACRRAPARASHPRQPANSRSPMISTYSSAPAATACPAALPASSCITTSRRSAPAAP